MTHLRFTLNLAGLLLLSVLLLATAPPYPTIGYDSAEVEITNASQLFLKGKTNINRFSCQSTESYPRMKVAYQVDEKLRKITFTPTFLPLTVDRMDCGQKEINRDMQEALQAETFPHIFIQLTSLSFTDDFSKLKEGEWQNITAQTHIKIAGVSKPATICLKARKFGQNGLQINGKQNLLMSSFGIEPPTTMLGLIRVQDEIEIHFDLQMVVKK